MDLESRSEEGDMSVDSVYLGLVEDVLREGVDLPDRTGAGRRSLFGRQMVFDRCPILTTKAVNWRAVREELLWFLRGETNVGTLGSTIWDAWADEDGELGPIYGHQWRRLGVDQIAELVRLMREEPWSRRMVVDSWNVEMLAEMRLVPCHVLFQVFCYNGRFDLQLYQRSADLMVGVPFNMVSYWMLMRWLSEETGLKMGRFVHTFGDVHIYKNHITTAVQQLAAPRLEDTAWVDSGLEVRDYIGGDKIKYDINV